MRSVILSCLLGIPVVLFVPLARQRLEGAASLKTAKGQGNSTRIAFRMCAPGLVEGAFREIGLRFEPAGRIESITVAEGDEVQEGDVLARLNDDVWQCQLAEAEARLSMAKADKLRLVNGARQESLDVLRADVKVAEVDVRQAEKRLKRTSSLADRRVVAAQELDDHVSNHESAEAKLRFMNSKLAELAAAARLDDVAIADARIALCEAQIRRVKTSLDQCVLRAPRNARVSKIRAEIGEVVGPNSQQAVLNLVDTQPTRVRAFVEELDAVRIVPGMTTTISADGLSPFEFRGRVISCLPAMGAKTNLTNANDERRDVRVRDVIIVLEEETASSQLVIGLPVDVTFEEGAGQ